MLILIFGGYLLSLTSAKCIIHEPNGEVVPNSYIVKLNKGVDTHRFIKNCKLPTPEGTVSPLIVHYTYSIMNGFAATLDANQFKNLSENAQVHSITYDQVARINAQTIVKQCPADWGLARLSQRQTLTRCDPRCYEYDSSAGGCCTVYVLDTGILTTHTEFEGRATWGANLVNVVGDGVNTDQNGHGTHVAGTIAGKTYGVAKQAQVVAVKVLGADGSGSYAGVIAGMDWVANNIQTNRMNIASMSLGGPYAPVMNEVVTALVAFGVLVTVAAGNGAQDASNFSPSGAPYAITVGATDTNDVMAWFSNFGPSVNMFAPGVNIKSAWIGNNTATNTISGTSMATPHVAGVVATLMCSDCRLSTPLAVTNRIIQLSDKGKICANYTACPPTPLPDNTPNILLNNGGHT